MYTKDTRGDQIIASLEEDQMYDSPDLVAGAREQRSYDQMVYYEGSTDGDFIASLSFYL